MEAISVFAIRFSMHVKALLHSHGPVPKSPKILWKWVIYVAVQQPTNTNT